MTLPISEDPRFCQSAWSSVETCNSPGIAALEFDGLSVSYRTRRGTVPALAGLDLTVPEGGVFGFLGANGAGKTTAIRVAVGLLRAPTGRVRVLGHDVPRSLGAVMDRVGALVEQPSFFPNFTGRRNLELLGRVRKIGPKSVTSVLAAVGLEARADARYATYSLGMKQRLGLAAALLKDPELLILDEPANGLDPPGIIDVRALMRSFADDGRTVFVSSHLLSEVEQVCDRVAIVARGACVASGTVAELLQEKVGRFRVRVDDERALDVLRRAGFDATAERDHTVVVRVESARSADITRALAAAGIYLAELTPVARTLEDVFVESTR